MPSPPRTALRRESGAARSPPYLSSCPFSGLHGPFHVAAPVCGCLRASKVNLADGLANHPSREQRGRTPLLGKGTEGK